MQGLSLHLQSLSPHAFSGVISRNPKTCTLALSPPGPWPNVSPPHVLLITSVLLPGLTAKLLPR
jgi:hypothetical protein